MCQSHMEAPAVVGTIVGAETREENGAMEDKGLDLGGKNYSGSGLSAWNVGCGRYWQEAGLGMEICDVMWLRADL